VVAVYDVWGKPAGAAGWRLRLIDADFPVDPFARLGRVRARLVRSGFRTL
jgi:hypothetical protein